MANSKIEEFNNIEAIVKFFKKKTRSFENIMKYDGITMEFTCKPKTDREEAKIKVSTICKEIGLTNNVLENNPNDISKFILQFPDMTPKYTEEEIQTMYIANFKWLLDDARRNKPDITKAFIVENTPKYVKLAVSTYVRSNVNKYKEKLDDYLNNTSYRQKLNMLFVTYLDEYWNKK